MDPAVIEFPSKQANGRQFKQEIWKRLLKGPATAAQLHAWCHQFHPQDAPAKPDSIKSLICLMNIYLRKHTYPFRIKNMGGRGGKHPYPYRIVRV